MPARTFKDGLNWADEIDYKLWNPVLENYQYIPLDEAVGCVIMMTEVDPWDGQVTVYVKPQEEKK